MEKKLNTKNKRAGVNKKVRQPKSKAGIKTTGRHQVATSRLRSIGNSKGVILSNVLIDTAGLSPDKEILIVASEGIITIQQIKDTDVNTELASWDAAFKKAKKQGAKPEKDLFEGIGNKFDHSDW
jgi:antitoxin component of MazEF toxin-antitoxin module